MSKAQVQKIRYLVLAALVISNFWSWAIGIELLVKIAELVHKHGFCDILTYVYMSDCYDI